MRPSAILCAVFNYISPCWVVRQIFFCNQGPKPLLAAHFPSGTFPLVFHTKILQAFVFFPIRTTFPDHLVSLGSIALMIFSEVYNQYCSDWLRAERSVDRIPVEARFSASVQTGPGAPSSLLYNGYWVFPGGKEWPGRETDPSPPSSDMVNERIALNLYSPCGPYDLYRTSVPVQG